MTRVWLRIAILAVFYTTILGSAFAQTPYRNQELLDKSGIKAHLAAYPAQMKQWMQSMFHGVAPASKQLQTAWNRLTEEIYTADKLMSQLDQSIERGLSAEEKAFLLRHYNSALGKRITEAKVRAAEMPDEEAASAYRQRVLSAADQRKRVQLLQEIDKATDATKNHLDTTIEMQLVIMAALQKEQGSPLDMDGLRTPLEKYRDTLTQKMPEYMLSRFGYIFRDSSEEELSGYVAFLKAPVTQRFNAILVDMHAGLTRSFRDKLLRTIKQRSI